MNFDEHNAKDFNRTPKYYEKIYFKRKNVKILSNNAIFLGSILVVGELDFSALHTFLHEIMAQMFLIKPKSTIITSQKVV